MSSLRAGIQPGSLASLLVGSLLSVAASASSAQAQAALTADVQYSPTGNPATPPYVDYTVKGVGTVTCPNGSSYTITVKLEYTNLGGTTYIIKNQTIYGSSSGVAVNYATDPVLQIARSGETI